MSRADKAKPVVVVEKSGNGLTPFLWGALLGAGLALLFAPRSGEETRRLLKNRGRRLLAAAEDKAEELQELIGGGYERTKAQIEEGIAAARRTIDEKREATRDAVDAGRSAVHSAREELERRLSEARAARAKARRGEDDESTS